MTRRQFLTGLCFLCIFGNRVLSYGKEGKRLVVFIRYRIEPNHFSNVVASFKRKMAQLGYVEGRDIEYVDIVTRSADRRSVPDVIEAVLKYRERADLFVTSGWVSMYARRLLKDTGVPQLFVPVLKSVAFTMLPSVTEPPNTNLSGVYLMYPPEKILMLAKEVIPAIERYAYVYDSRIPADMTFKHAYEELSAEKRLNIGLYFFDLAKGADWVVSMLEKERIQGFGGIVGVFKNRERLSVLDVPIITSLTLDIEQDEIAVHVKGTNIVAGLFNSFGYCGQQAAVMAYEIFSGRKSVGALVPEPARQVAFVNLEAAERLGLFISFNVLDAVDLIVK